MYYIAMESCREYIIHEIATNDGKGIVRIMVRNRCEKFIKRILNHTKCGIEINIIYTV